MASVVYVTQADLENALGVQLVRAVYDDDNDGDPEPAALAACFAYATSECNSFLRGSYTLPILALTDELMFAALDFACAYTARRRPELTHTLGVNAFKDFYDAAVAKMKRYDNAEQRLSPEAAGNPSNIDGYQNTPTNGDGSSSGVDGLHQAGVDGLTNADGSPARVFDRMGDF